MFSGLKLAHIDEAQCTRCNQCVKSCHFQAIDDDIRVHADSCEGCGVCAYVCPVHAITMVDRESGVAYRSQTRFGPMAHAVLHTAEEASGKLVTMVRNMATDLAGTLNKDLVLIDGPPGIGCPVIASITGVDLVVIVTEPTYSAIHDLERVHAVALHFHIPAVVCINKASINDDNTRAIEQYCKDHALRLVGTLPYDLTITQAMIHEQSIIEFSDGPLTRDIRAMWQNITEVLYGR